MVEALSIPIYDIITDARPDSKTFGMTHAYLLDPSLQNKLYVPHGFLHAFAVPQSDKDIDAMFMYYCDNIYDHESEICINPMTLIPYAIKEMNISNIDELFTLEKMFECPEKIILSEKDLCGKDYCKFMKEQEIAYKSTGKLWYKDV